MERLIAWREAPGRTAAALAGFFALLVIASALLLQYGFGYAPCPLCLQQRWPYYVGVPAAALLALPPWSRRLRAAGLCALAALFAWGLWLGVYQAGAEWSFWPGPRDCSAGNSGANPADVGGLIEAIQQSVVVSCTDPRLRVLGLSLAGWNAVVMGALIALVLGGAFSELRASRRAAAATGATVRSH